MRIEIVSPSYRRIALALCAILLGALLCGCTFYIVHSPAYLATWFRGLNPCFYRNIYWQRDFFTPDVKRHGNIICIAGIAGIGILSVLLFRKRTDAAPRRFIIITLSGWDVFYLLLLLLTGMGMWCYAHHHILPYMDEVFSAIHCAEGPPFQTLAYYMLPNNHVFYNLINNLVFHWADDHVFTGRLISGASFLCLLILLYGWCRQLLKHRFLAFLATLTISVHFQTWGFGAMGRGYELCLLSEWLAFIALWQYARTNEKFWLQLFCIAVIIGFTTLPTYLFFFSSLMMMALLLQANKRTIDLEFWRYTVVALIFIFLFYLPSLCFSGLHAYIANEYVAPKDMTRAHYFFIAIDKIREAIVYCFTGYFTKEENYYLILGAIPLCSLLFFRNRKSLFIGLFFILMWGGLLVISCQLRQSAYLRNLIGHLSITYAFIIITVFLLLQRLFQWIKMQRMIVLLFPLFLGLFCYHFVKMANERLAKTLYHFDINRYGELLEMDLRDLPPKADIAFSDESFYLLYLSRKKGFTTHECGAGNETYYIKIDGELLPQPPTGHYQLMWERGDYRIYQRQAN